MDEHPRRVDACRNSRAKGQGSSWSRTEAERDEHKATRLLPHMRRSSDLDVPATEMDDFFLYRKTDRGLMTVLDCESGCTFACAFHKGPGGVFVGVICKGFEFCGRRGSWGVLGSTVASAMSSSWLSMSLCCRWWNSQWTLLRWLFYRRWRRTTWRWST